jgi:hypothetical protein
VLANVSSWVVDREGEDDVGSLGGTVFMLGEGVRLLVSAEANMESNKARPLFELDFKLAGGCVGTGGSWSSEPPEAANKDSTVILDVEFGIRADVEGEGEERVGVCPNFAKSMSDSETPPLA